MWAAARHSGFPAEALLWLAGRAHVDRVETTNAVDSSLLLPPHCGQGTAGALGGIRRQASHPQGACTLRYSRPRDSEMLVLWPPLPAPSLRAIPPARIPGLSRTGAPLGSPSACGTSFRPVPPIPAAISLADVVRRGSRYATCVIRKKVARASRPLKTEETSSSVPAQGLSAVVIGENRRKLL
jgi:hypothetical protein